MGCGSRNWEQLLFGWVCISLRKVMLKHTSIHFRVLQNDF